MSASFTMFTFPPPGDGFSTTWWWLFHPMWKSHHQVMESAHSIWHLGISWWTSALTVVPQLKREFLEILIKFHCWGWELDPALRQENPWLWPQHITAWMILEGYWVYRMNTLVVFYWGCIGGQPQRSILTSGLWFWKIAGLRPAIFSGTPRNFEAIFTML